MRQVHFPTLYRFSCTFCIETWQKDHSYHLLLPRTPFSEVQKFSGSLKEFAPPLPHNRTSNNDWKIVISPIYTHVESFRADLCFSVEITINVQLKMVFYPGT